MTKNINLLWACTLGTLLTFVQTYEINAQYCTPSSVGCSNTDHSNSFLNANNPNTIEYDNIVSTFHSTIARESDGKVLVWGERIANDGTSHVLTPQELNSTNYPALTGEVLKFTGGSRNGGASATQQFVVLTTTGLFAWGVESHLIHADLTSSNTFQKITVNGKADGLPPGVAPEDVKMLFGTYSMLGLVTCDGAAWTLVNAIGTSVITNPEYAYGDGSALSTANNLKWHRVRTSAVAALEDVVALRGGGLYTFMALKSDGTVWTWGYKTYLGDGTAPTARPYATQMTLPSGVIPKMIGMKGAIYYNDVNYYLLSTSGELYGLGMNNTKQLGNFLPQNSPSSNSWVRAQKSATAGDFFTNIAWISPVEHDAESMSSVNVLTSDSTLWSWGSNSFGMIGGGSNVFFIDPTQNPGGLTALDKLLAVETGGHTTIVVKACTNKFGYVGHRINGSMGDGNAATANELNYNFSTTSALDLCAAPSTSRFITPDSTSIFRATPFTVETNGQGTFSIYSGNATINATTGVLTATTAGVVKVVFMATELLCNETDTLTLIVEQSLPVNLVSFTAARSAAGSVLLKWITVGEKNNKGFAVERSIDGVDWEYLGFVYSNTKNGDSEFRQEYSFKDLSPLNGTNLYRLIQTDFDGKIEYSPIRMIKVDEKENISLYPNPAYENVTISNLEGSEIIFMYDITGGLVYKSNVEYGKTNISIPLHSFSNGIYQINIICADGSIILKKLLKN